MPAYGPPRAAPAVDGAVTAASRCRASCVAGDWRAKMGGPEVIRWRNEHGRVVSGYVKAFDSQAREWVVTIPDWITGDVEIVRVPETDAVVGSAPWPSYR